MPDAPDPPENSDLPEQGDRIPTAAPGDLSPKRRSPLTRGQNWRTYEIGEPLPCDLGWCFRAIHVSLLEDVVIRLFPCGEHVGMRAKAWDELCTLKTPGVVQSIDAHEEEGYRFEISAVPPETTLREWASCRQASIDDIQHVMQQLALILGELHERGIVHLNLRPETIYVAGAESGLQIIVGGLENATLYNQPTLVPVPVDPFYAPPEAAGLVNHQPGAGLRAWDWWSAGRVTQEIVLGRHVLGYLVGREVTRMTPELKTRAEELLLERDPRAPRAGAVEVMPPMNHRLELLLRGLLTSSRDGRWGVDEVERWLVQETVQHRYQLGRNEELFPWQDRMFTVPEAAEHFSKEENWADGVVNLFAADDRSTLVSFVSERPAYASVRDQIGELHTFMQVPNWTGLPEEITRTAIAAAAWLLLGPDGSKLSVCGRRVDNECLRGLLARGSAVNGVELLRALTALPYVQMIEKEDADAARLLGALAQVLNGPVVADAGRRGWVDLTAEIDSARLYHFALEPKKRLEETLRMLRARYACARSVELQALFLRPSPSLEELVVLACTAANPERHGYVSHDEWNREQHASLERRGGQLGRSLFWLHLRGALLAGWLVAGWWPAVTATWVLIGIAQMFLAGPWQGLLAAGCLAALRAVSVVLVNHLIQRHSPGAARWTWTSRLYRCREEALAAHGGEVLPREREVSRAFASVNAAIVALPVEPRFKALRPPVAVAGGWTLAVASWLIVLGGFWELVWRPFDRVPPAEEHALVAPVPALPPPTAEESFFDDPRVPRVRWNVAAPGALPAFPLIALKRANPDQVAAALIDGQKLLLPYARSTVDALIAVPVEDAAGTGLMIYDARSRQVVQRRLLVPKQIPDDKTWFQFNNLQVFYVGGTPAAEVVVPVAGAPKKADPPADLPEREAGRRQYSDTAVGAQ